MHKHNTIFGHKYKEQTRPKVIPKVLVNKPSDIPPNPREREKKIDLIVVSVNYNDYLTLSLENNIKYFNSITVVTSTDDVICQNICRTFGVKCLITDVFFENSFKFNKGAGINFGLNSIQEPDFVLILDADILVTSNIDLKKLNEETLYTSDRWICHNDFQYDRWKKGEISVTNIGKYERDSNYGFFQLYNFNNSLGVKWYPHDMENSSHPDLKFSSLFANKQTIETEIIHLGDIKKNWDGRKSESFITEEKIFEILDDKTKFTSFANSESRVVSLEKKSSKYGKFKIENQITFDHHNGGWQYAIETLDKVNHTNGLRLECFLDKNFCWINSHQEVIEEDWVGILHHPVDGPSWYLNQVRNKQIYKSSNFIKSLETCKGLYVFSEYEKCQLLNKIYDINSKIKINVLRHPVKKSEKKWSIDKFLSDKKITHVGWWLRDIQSFYRLETNIRKIRIRLSSSIENKINQIFKLKSDSVIEIENVNELEYDEVLCSSIVFINLIDSVINNTVLECIERNTPILVNRNPSIEEYIGIDYPLFYNDLSDINKLITEENLIKANKYLEKINLDRDLGRQIQQSEIYKSIDSELNITEMFKPGDLPESEGGIYNPGFCRFNKKNYLIVRVEQFTEKERGVEELWKKTSSVPYIIELDENMNPIDTFELEIFGKFKRAEDFRLFTHNNKLYSNHIILDESDKIYPVISEIDISSRKMKIKGRPILDLPLKEVEKNWVFYSKKDELYLIYSISPLIVFKIDLETMTGKIHKMTETNFTWNKSGFISNSTNPIKVSDNYNIMGFHSRDKKLIYHQGLVIFDNDFNIINSSNEPYLSGGDIDTIHTNVIYTSSLEIIDGKLVGFAGDGDYKTIKIEFKDKVWKELL